MLYRAYTNTQYGFERKTGDFPNIFLVVNNITYLWLLKGVEMFITNSCKREKMNPVEVKITRHLL